MADKPDCVCVNCRAQRLLRAAKDADIAGFRLTWGADGRICRLFLDDGEYVEVPPAAGTAGDDSISTAIALHPDRRWRKPIPADALAKFREDAAKPTAERMERARKGTATIATKTRAFARKSRRK